MTALAYELAEHLGKFRTDSTPDEKKNGKEARYPVLSYLVLRANKRNRAFPKIDTIAKETGYGRQRVIEALAWLEKRGAIMDVPRHLRIGDERKAHFNNAVYQLTGFIKLCGESIRYLHMGGNEKPETREDLPDDPNLTVSTKTVPTATKQSVRKTKVNQYDKRELVSTTNVAPSLYERNHLNDSKERLSPDPHESAERIENKTVHENAGEGGEKKQEHPAPAPRKRDALFDAVVEACFDTNPYNPDEVAKLGGRVGGLSTTLRRVYKAEYNDQQLAEKLKAFKQYWLGKGLSMPQAEKSLLPNFKKFLDSNVPRPAPEPRHNPDCQHCKGKGYIKVNPKDPLSDMRPCSCRTIQNGGAK